MHEQTAVAEPLTVNHSVRQPVH